MSYDVLEYCTRAVIRHLKRKGIKQRRGIALDYLEGIVEV